MRIVGSMQLVCSSNRKLEVICRICEIPRSKQASVRVGATVVEIIRNHCRGDVPADVIQVRDNGSAIFATSKDSLTE